MAYSDSRQEAWLREVFGDTPGHAIDVGANDGSFYSNTLALEEFGWTVLCVEANPIYEEPLKVKRKLIRMVAAGDRDEEQTKFYVNLQWMPSGSSLIWGEDPRRPESVQLVKLRTIDRLLDEAGFPKVDLMSIDIEGTELDALKGANLDKWKPKAIIVEWRGGRPDLVPFLTEHGYRLSERISDDECWLKA